MSEKTWIRNADWIVAWDANAGRHAYLRDADLVFSGSTNIHVGKNYAGLVDMTIDGQDRLLSPGLVNLHLQPRDDVRILAETGTMAAHCPSPGASYGRMLEGFGRYRRTSVSIGIGTHGCAAHPDRGDAVGCHPSPNWPRRRRICRIRRRCTIGRIATADQIVPLGLPTLTG